MSTLEHDPTGNTPEPGPRVVVISASAGAGHDGVTRELADRLRGLGCRVDCADLADVMPWRLGRLLRGTYHGLLIRLPWLYDGLFAVGCRFSGAGPATRALLRPVRRPMLSSLPPDTSLVVSVYPIVSQVLGPLRRQGLLTTPVVTYLTDFAVHPIWVSPGIDVHCAAHETSRAQATALGARDVRVAGRVVSPACRPPSAAARLRARDRFGLPAAGRLALLVAGSWGVGEVAAAAREIAATGAAVPVTVCGHNTALYRRLRRARTGHVFGWVSDMPALMQAVDVLVENAGGLTALEAMASGLPVLTYRPIPGHGRANAATMAEAGVVRLVRHRDELGPALADLIDGARAGRQRSAGLALFESDPAAVIAALARGAYPGGAPPREAPVDAGPTREAATNGGAPREAPTRGAAPAPTIPAPQR